MQVRAGCQPRRADIANYLTLFHRRTGFETAGITVEMRVKRFVIILVINSDALAVIAFHAKGGNHAITRSKDRRAASSGKIHPTMQAREAKYRVFAKAIARGKSCAVQWGLHQ